MRSESSSSCSGCCSSGADDGARTRRLTTRGDSEHRAERPPATAHVRPHRAGNQRRGAGGADRVSRPADVAARAVRAAVSCGDRCVSGAGENVSAARGARSARPGPRRSEEHTSELQSHSFISYAVFCLKKNKQNLLNFGFTDSDRVVIQILEHKNIKNQKTLIAYIFNFFLIIRRPPKSTLFPYPAPFR